MNLLSKLTPYQGRKSVLVYNQSVGDIITGILETHKLHAQDYDKIAPYFDADNVKDICKKIYDYLKANTHYVIESDEKQTLRSPASILKLGANPNIGLDCKSYSLFTNGILDALRRRGKNIDFCYRFASYKPFDKIPHHVFSVVNPGTPNEIWTDNVINRFNLHKPYNYKIDKKINMLYSISGIGKKTTAQKETRKAKAKATLAKIKSKAKVVLKVLPVSALGRNAFLAVTKLIFKNLAGQMNKAIQKDESALKQFWESIGGDYTALKKSIEVGRNKKAIGGFDEYASIGVVAPATASLATPIILKVVALLKKLGINPADAKKFATDTLKKVANKKLAKLKSEAKGEPQAEDKTEAETPGTSPQGGQAPQTAQRETASAMEAKQTTEANEANEAPGATEAPTMGISKNTILIGAGVLALGFLAFRKK